MEIIGQFHIGGLLHFGGNERETVIFLIRTVTSGVQMDKLRRQQAGLSKLGGNL